MIDTGKNLESFAKIQLIENTCPVCKKVETYRIRFNYPDLGKMTCHSCREAIKNKEDTVTIFIETIKDGEEYKATNEKGFNLVWYGPRKTLEELIDQAFPLYEIEEV